MEGVEELHKDQRRKRSAQDLRALGGQKQEVLGPDSWSVFPSSHRPTQVSVCVKTAGCCVEHALVGRPHAQSFASVISLTLPFVISILQMGKVRSK